jgi:hypothetical protein
MNKNHLIEDVRNSNPPERQTKLSLAPLKSLASDSRGHNFSYYFNNILIGHSRISIDHQERKVRGFDFYPFEFVPELRGMGLGALAFGSLLIEGVRQFGIRSDYIVEERIDCMQKPFKVMLERLGAYDMSIEKELIAGNTSDATYIEQFQPFFDRVVGTLNKRGYKLPEHLI